MNPDLRRSELRLSGPDLTGLLRDVLAKDASFRFRAGGSSMHPFIRDGDVVTVSPLRGTAPKPGDIAAFTRPGCDRLAVHRIVATRKDSVLVKGDNARDHDGLIPASQVLGRVTGIERNGRKLRLGLGPERRLIALLNRMRLLPALLMPVRRLYRLFVPRTSAT